MSRSNPPFWSSTVQPQGRSTPRRSAMSKSVASPERGVAAGVTSAGGVWIGPGLGAEQAAITHTRDIRVRRFIGWDVSHPTARGSTAWALIALVFHVSACGRSESGEAGADTSATSPQPADTDASAPTSTPPAPPPRLGELRMNDLTPPELRPAAIPPLLGDLVKQALDKDFVRAPEDDPGACRAAIAIGYTLLVNRQPVLDADAGEARAFFEGELYCPAPRGASAAGAGADIDAFRLELDARRHFGGAAGGSATEGLTEALRAVLADGADGLFGQARMRRAGDDEIRRTLAGSDHPGLLAEAASESSERRLADVVPDLVRLTGHPNLRVGTRAGAALGLLEVASPEVIRALVRMTDGPEPERHLIAIHALADLGTPEARRYLESLAVGHPSPALREIARERLRELGQAVPPEADDAPEPVPDPLPQP